MSNDLFQRLISAAPEIDFGSAARWITRLSEEDSDFLAKAKIEGLKLGRKLGVCTRSYDGKTFVSLVGFEDAELRLPGLERVEATPAHFQLTVIALDLNPSASEADIRNALEGRDSTDATYSGHDLDEIAPLFPTIDYYEILAEAPIATLDMDRLLGVAICKSNYDTPLPIGGALRDTFTEIFETAPSHYPTFLALQGIVSAFWQTQFLEIYRTIEQLFPAHAVSKLASRISYTDTAHSLFSELSRALGWRPREDGALERLFDDVPNEIVEILRQIFGVSSDEEKWKSIVSRRVYEVRNSNVHFRSSSDGFEFDDNEWSKLNEAMARISLHLYGSIGSSYLAMRSAAA